MKKKKALILIAAVAGAVAIGAGCGKKMTAEDLVAEVTKNTENKKSVEAAMDLDFSGKISMQQSGVTAGIDMKMGMNMDIKALTDKDNPENASAHMKGTVDVEMMGASMSVDMENYTVAEDGKMANYTGTQGQWVRQEEDLAEASGAQNELLGMDFESFIKDGVKAELADKTEKIGDKECYKLTVGVSGDMINELMDMSSGFMGNSTATGGTDSLDFSDTTLDYVMYIDKSEKVPVRITIDAGSVMASVMKALEESGASAEIDKFDITVDIKGYDTIDEITVPDDVKAQAADSSSTDGLLGEELNGGAESETQGDTQAPETDESYTTDENGNPVITNYEGSHTAAIVVPEGYDIGYTEETFLGLNGDTADVSYMFNDYATDEDMKKDTLEAVVKEHQDEYLNYKKSDVMEFELNGQKVRWFKETYSYMESPCVDVKAWIAVDDQTMFACEIDKFGVKDNEDTTQEEVSAILNGVTIK